MKKILSISLFLLTGLCLNAKEPMRLDAANDEVLVKSFSAISMTLEPDTRQDFSNASAIIMFYGSAMGYNEVTMREIFNNKTAKELIDIAQSYCPSTKDDTYKLKSATKEEFSRSFIVMLMNLPIESQRKFSYIIAQVMMIAKLNNLDEELLIKDLNGMTAKEIIEKFDAVKASAEATKK